MDKKFEKPEISKSNGLVLYCYIHNYYSQKVLIAMYEKKLDFQIYSLDVASGEQFSEWFLKMSPRGDIPVLQDALIIVPEATKIFQYIDHLYYTTEHSVKNGGPCKTKLTVQKIEYLRSTINKMPVGPLTIGCFIHDQYCTKIKQPYIGPVRDALLAADSQLVTGLREMALQRPELKDFFLRKADTLERRRNVLINFENFKIILNSIDSLLEIIEKEYEDQEDIYWLCGSHFTLLDVSLGIFLQRLYILGLEDYFWTRKKKPHIEQYFQNFMKRESVKKGIPSAVSTMKAIWGTIPSTYRYAVFALGISSVALASSVMLK